MSYIIKTAAVTQKSVNGEFNSDNLNLNGRVLSIENANGGFKGAGSMRAPFAVAFASSPYNGFAGAALTALSDRLDALKEDENRFATVLNGYFVDSRNALEQCNCDSDGLAVSILIGYENRLVAAKMGNACILRYTDGDLINMGVGQDVQQSYFCETIDTVVDGDLFVLCPETALSALTEGEIIVALNAADGNEKKAVQLLASKFAKRNSDVSDTFVVIRIEQQADPAVVAPVAAQPVVAEQAETVADPQEDLPDSENVYEPETEDYAEQPQSDSRKKILLWAILCVALILVMAITGFAAYKIAFARNHADVSAGVVVSGGDAQYDVDIDQTAEVPTTELPTEVVTEEATSENATEEATQEATEADTTTEDDDDYYYDDDDDYYDDDDGYYDDDEDDVTVPETVPRPTEAPSEAPTETPTDAPEDTPTDAPDNNEEEPTAGRPIEAPTDNGTFEEF